MAWGSAMEERAFLPTGAGKRRVPRPLDPPAHQQPTNPPGGPTSPRPRETGCAPLRAGFRESVSNNFGANFWWKIWQNRRAKVGWWCKGDAPSEHVLRGAALYESSRTRH